MRCDDGRNLFVLRYDAGGSGREEYVTQTFAPPRRRPCALLVLKNQPVNYMRTCTILVFGGLREILLTSP